MWLDTKTTDKDDDWHEWRKAGIGGSDCSVLLDCNPWKSRMVLYLEKIGEKEQFRGNVYTQRGIDLEPKARELYNELRNTKATPCRLVHPDYSWLRANFDGIDFDKKVVIEIKCPGEKDHATAIRGCVPVKYMPQCQWLMMVSGYSSLDYVSWDGVNPIVVVKVEKDPVMQARLISEGAIFWKAVQDRVPPKEPEEDLQVIQVIGEGYAAILSEYVETKAKISSLEKQNKLILDKLKTMLTSKMARCGQYLIKVTERKGSVDYASIPQLYGVDLEQYRGEPTKIYSIT
jgi:putative phage-type endonuclease